MDVLTFIATVGGVVLIPIVVDRASRRRSAWHPAVVHDLEELGRRVTCVRDAFTRAKRRPLQGQDGNDMLEETHLMANRIEILQTRLRPIVSPATAETLCRPLLDAVDGLTDALSVRSFPTIGFTATDAEAKSVCDACDRLYDGIYKVQRRLAEDAY